MDLFLSKTPRTAVHMYCVYNSPSIKLVCGSEAVSFSFRPVHSFLILPASSQRQLKASLFLYPTSYPTSYLSLWVTRKGQPSTNYSYYWIFQLVRARTKPDLRGGGVYSTLDLPTYHVHSQH